MKPVWRASCEASFFYSSLSDVWLWHRICHGICDMPTAEGQFLRSHMIHLMHTTRLASGYIGYSPPQKERNLVVQISNVRQTLLIQIKQTGGSGVEKSPSTRFSVSAKAGRALHGSLCVAQGSPLSRARAHTHTHSFAGSHAHLVLHVGCH